LEQKLRDLEQDKTLERVESLFATTPIASTNNFSAVSVNVKTTDFEFNNNPMMVFPLPLAVVIGGVIGAFYVLISNAIRKRKEQLGEA
jgi:LPS O-antigen subunit length determinant protein (WzzB/FepE family)